MKENDNNSLAETLVNYEMLIEMIPELGEVVYTGMVTLDAAKAVFQELSEVNQIDFVESLDCVKRMLQQRDSRIKEMENDIAAKTVVETPADYIPLQKANRDMERQNEFLEARIRKLDKENGQLKRQLAELQRKQDPEQERLMSTLLANPLILIAASVTAAVSAFSAYKRSIEEAVDKAQEAGNAYRIRCVGNYIGC